MSKRIPLLVACLLLVAFPAAAQQFTYKWTPVRMDTTWDAMHDFRATRTIEKYSPQVAPLQEIIAYSADEYDKQRPERACPISRPTSSRPSPRRRPAGKWTLP